jgi:ACS family tartrate transporter-like MFS transporter
MSQIAVYALPDDIESSDIERSTIRAVSFRILPFLILSYFLCVLDRVNVSFAATTMNADLGFTPLMYAWGAGIFFIGYFILEVPSNIALHSFGARRWISRIMVTWGLISSATALVSGPSSFYTLRFLLGVAEAGFFPGIILYLTYWYPAKYRARGMSAFFLGVPLSAVLGGPICGLLLEMNNVLGLKGWQWLFIVEGIPSSILGVVAFFYLTDRPADAKWLAPEQKRWLEAELDSELRASESVDVMTLRQALTSSKVLLLSVIYFGLLAGLYGIQFWLPQIIRSFGLTNIQTGLLSALPFGFGTIAMFAWGRRSDRSRERIWHIAIPLFLTAAALIASAYAGGLPLTMAALITAAIGGFAAVGLFWTLPTAYLSGVAAAGGIALIGAVGNLAGFGGPYLIGWFKETTGSTVAGLFVLAVLPAIAGLLVLALGRGTKTEFADKGERPNLVA